MTSKGGARPGAGRKPGTRNKKTEALLNAAKATGLLPHELLLKIARDEIGDNVLLAYNMFGEPQYGRPDLRVRLRAAEAAAPYYAPKLSQIDAKIEDTTTHYLICDSPMSIDEFSAKYGICMDATAEAEDLN